MKLNQIYHGDVRELASDLPSSVVQCILTSPPYFGHRDYHLDPVIWDQDDSCDHEAFIQTDRAPTKNALQGSTDDKYQALVRYQEIQTPGRFCKACGAWIGVLGHEPSPERYIKHIADIFDLLKPALRDDGVCWIVIGDSYARRKQRDIKPKDLILIPDMLRLELRRRGWYIRASGPWVKPNAKPDSARDRPTVSHEDVILITKNANKSLFWTHETKPGVRKRPDPESFWIRRDAAGRTANLPLADAGMWIQRNKWRGHDYYYDMNAVRIPCVTNLGGASGRTRQLRTSDLWERSLTYLFSDEFITFVRNTFSFHGAHFATFPPALVADIIRISSPALCCGECRAPYAQGETYTGEVSFERWGTKLGVAEDQGVNYGGIQSGMIRVKKQGPFFPTCDCDTDEAMAPIILDPFCGSGTTLGVARLLRRSYIGFDANADYVKLSEKRIQTIFESKEAGRILEEQCQMNLC